MLLTGRDFVTIDFEGDPARTLSDRRGKRSPFRDVADMLFSFAQAGRTALHEQHEAVAWWPPAARPCPPRCPWIGAVALWVSVPGTTA